MKKAIISGPVLVEMESPFICTFLLNVDNEDIVAALIGNKGRALHKTLKQNDAVRVLGYYKDGSHLGYGVVYAIKEMEV